MSIHYGTLQIDPSVLNIPEPPLIFQYLVNKAGDLLVDKNGIDLTNK